MKFEIPEHNKLVYEMRLLIRWDDMDAMNQVNNTVQSRYLETCCIEWRHSIGFVPDAASEGPVILNAYCNFYTQLDYSGDMFMRNVCHRPRPRNL